jgi:hypothetical protein
MSHLSRWFVVLGLVALLPAVIVLGGSIGEVMRHPSLGWGEILQHESQVVGLGVIATVLLSTAAGLENHRRWALVVGIAVSVLLLAGGLILLVGNAGLLAVLGIPQILGLFVVMLGLAALLAGARLLRALWETVSQARPFEGADVRAFAALGGVVVLGTLGHLLLSRLAT